MSRRDVLTRDEDCADEGGHVAHCSTDYTPFRKPFPRWLVLIGRAITLVFGMIVAGTIVSVLFAKPCEAQPLRPDSSAVVIVVHNYLPTNAEIFLRADTGSYSSLGQIVAGSLGILVIPSRQLGTARMVYVAAMLVGHHMVDEGDPVPRIPGVVNVIAMPLGTRPSLPPRS